MITVVFADDDPKIRHFGKRNKKEVTQMVNVETPLTFLSTDWFTGILVMALTIPIQLGSIFPIYSKNNQGFGSLLKCS